MSDISKDVLAHRRSHDTCDRGECFYPTVILLAEQVEAAEAERDRLREENEQLREDVKLRGEAARIDATRLREALQRVKTNADSWHGPEGLGTGHARALAVIADWCDDALAGEDT